MFDNQDPYATFMLHRIKPYLWSSVQLSYTLVYLNEVAHVTSTSLIRNKLFAEQVSFVLFLYFCNEEQTQYSIYNWIEIKTNVVICTLCTCYLVHAFALNEPE